MKMENIDGIYSNFLKSKPGVADALKNDVDRVVRRLVRERRQKESNDAQMTIKNIGDRVNTDAAKHIKANANEEIVPIRCPHSSFER